MTRDEIMSMDEDALQFAIAVRLSDDSVEVGGVVYMHSKPALDWPRDIAAAIDLLDSMTYPPEPDGTVVKVEYVIYRETYIHTGGVWPLAAPVYNVEIFGRNPINGEDFDATGDTLALAASRAWLMWKDGK